MTERTTTIGKWLIVDTSTGAMNGFFTGYKDARGAFERARERGARTLVLCEVSDSTGCPPITDATYWTTHSIGFAGIK